MISINNNMGGMRSHDALQQSHRVLQTALERLSTGLRINRAEDDAAGIMVRDRFQSQVNGFEEGIRNIQTAQGMIQVAEQGLNKITDALQQMRQLAVRAADDNLTDEDRGRIQNQIKGLLREVNERAQRTTYNGKNLLDGSIADPHAARDGSGKLQSNSFLSSGQTLLNGVSTVGTAATTVGAISQGSYEVKLVFDPNHRDTITQSTLTTLKGENSQGFAYLNSKGQAGTVISRSEKLTDRQGNVHDVNFVFTSTSANTWSYTASGGIGGAWNDQADFNGTLTFDSSGNLSSMTAAGANTTLVGQKVTKVISDGTSSGQSWDINFGFMKNNAQPPAVDNPVEPGNGLVNGQETTQVTFHSHLDSTGDPGTVYNGPSVDIVDRIGTIHTIQFKFTKTIDQTGAGEAADTWQMWMTDVGAGGAWTGASTGTSGVNLEFDSSGTLIKTNGQNGRLLDVVFADGTADGQNVVVDMSLLSSTPAASNVTLSADGNAPGQTLAASYTGNLDRDEMSGYSATLGSGTFLDFGGLPHGVDVTFTKTGRNAWSYQINGLNNVSDHWNGIRTNAGLTSGTMTFDDLGNMTTLNGGAPGSFTITVEDGTIPGQPIVFNLAAITQQTNGTVNLGPVDLTPTQNGNALNSGTTTFNPSGTLNASADTAASLDPEGTASYNLNFFDATGAAHSVTLTLPKTANNTTDTQEKADTWHYEFSAPVDPLVWTSGITTSTPGATGDITFDNSGATTATTTLQITDGAGTTQDVLVDFSALTSVIPTPVATTVMESGGVPGSNPTTGLTVSAVLDDGIPYGTDLDTNVVVYDGTGAAHNMIMRLSKGDQQPGLDDRWDYYLFTNEAPHDDWPGFNVGTALSGVIYFDSSGNISSVIDLDPPFSTYPPNNIPVSIPGTTLANQNITLDVSGLTVAVASTPINSVTGTQDGTNATPATPSSTFTLTGAIDSDRLTPTGNDTFTRVITLTDAIGDQHNVNMVFTKQDTDLWDYEIQIPAGPDGDWTGGGSANLTGTLLFDNDTHALSQINGGAVSTFNVTINDRNGNQTVNVDLTALTQPTDGTTGDSVTPVAITADLYETTNTSTWASRLVSGAGPTEFKIFPVFDRTGMDTIDGVKVTFTQVGDTNSWSWAVTAPAVSGLTGEVRGGTGTVNFDHAGNILGPTSFSATLDDGTPEGQTIQFNIGNLRMGRTSDLSATTTDGGESGDQSIDAVITYSGEDGGTTVVMTLESVSRGAQTANLGGISFTVNQATSLDAGLTAFVKAHTYISGTSSDDSLQFQVGPDEGMVTRLGIRKMDVQSIFRGGNGGYDYQDIKLDTQLQAQDLIGALDDAINYVSEENLKVGNFQNHMSRTLELARQQQTSITGALSNLNDADMALEATNQSKRSILVQSGTAMVAQANTQGQFLLQLLR